MEQTLTPPSPTSSGNDPTDDGAIFPTVLDSTQLSAFDSCPRKWYHQHCLGLSAGASIHLIAGAAFAKGLEAARLEFWYGSHDMQRATEEGSLAFIREWDASLPKDEMGDPLYEFGDDQTKNIYRCHEAFTAYLHEHPFDVDKLEPVILQGDKPAVEFSFAIPLEQKHPVTGDPLVYAGRLDLLGYYMGVPAVVDEKTTGGSLNEAWVRQWSTRGQFIGYAWAAHHYGVNVEYAIVRGIQILKTKINFLTAPVRIHNYMIERWWQTTNIKIAQMIGYWNAQVFPYSFGDACSSYGGCQFQNLCTAPDPSTWYDNYERRWWNPLDVLPTRDHLPPRLLKDQNDGS